MTSEQTAGDTVTDGVDMSKYEGANGEAVVNRWLKEITTVKETRQRRNYEKAGEKIVKIYRNQLTLDSYLKNTSTLNHVMFNVLWSNVQILKPALFARMPKVVVERRFKDQDPVGRLAAWIAERCTTYQLDEQKDKFCWVIKSCVEDRLLPGIGQAFVRYDADMVNGVDVDGDSLSDDDSSEPLKVAEPGSEKALVEYVFWQDYITNVSRSPYDLRWQARKIYMTRAELIEMCGEEIGKQVSLSGDKKKDALNDTDGEFLRQAEVWIVEELATKMRLWISPGYKKAPLKVVDDKLNLKGFFSYPRPLLATTTTDNMIPTADYIIYERLAGELDYVTKRLSAMVECVRLVGMVAGPLYDKIQNVLKLKDGDLWPIENWAAFMDKGGLAGAINWLPFDKAVEAIPALTQQQANLMSQIDLITGIPDLLRGSTDAGETAAAIQKKSHWMVLKMQERQEDVQRFCRDLIGKVAEIIFEPGLFSDETIALMCGADQMPEDDKANYGAALALLRDDRLNTFRVDIETDSTIAADEDQDIAQWQEYMTSISNLVSQVQGVSQFAPELLHPMIESAKSAARMLRTGKNVEGAWDSAWKQVEDRMQNPPQEEPPPDPQLIRAQNEGMKIQQDGELKSQELMLKQQELEMKGQEMMLKGQEFEFKAQEAQLAAQAQSFEENMKVQEFGLKAKELENDFEIASQDLLIKASSVQTKAQIDALVLELNQFKENFAQVVATKTLEIEQFQVLTSQKEKLMEEARLQKQSEIESMKFAHEHILALKELEHNAKIAEVSTKATKESSSSSSPKMPDIHVHTGGGVKKISLNRDASGNLIGGTSSDEDQMESLDKKI